MSHQTAVISTETASADGQNSLYGGIARSLTRGLALYFSRPVRLFRPSKVSGWTSLRGAAAREGAVLTPQYISLIIKEKGLLILPRHFLPPLAINTLLGTLLFQSYSHISTSLSNTYPDRSTKAIAALSGAAAGALQSVFGAPADNVRILLEGSHNNGVSGWRDAWKTVFRGTEIHNSNFGPRASANSSPLDQSKTRSEARDLKRWMNEVRGMAGRGWEGWGWGCAKDIVGFSLFFTVFEVTRDISSEVAITTRSLVQATDSSDETKVSSAPRIARSVTLVAGGVLAGLGYEVVGRPFDVIRRLLHLESVQAQSTTPSRAPIPLIPLIWRGIRDHGVSSLFRAPTPLHVDQNSHNFLQARMHQLLRTLMRVGPWGAGFLVWNLWDESVIESL